MLIRVKLANKRSIMIQFWFFLLVEEAKATIYEALSWQPMLCYNTAIVHLMFNLRSSAKVSLSAFLYS